MKSALRHALTWLVPFGALAAAAGIARAAPLSAAATTAAPAGIGQYSYLQFEGFDWGSSDYFGSSASGEGFRFSYRWSGHAFVTGEYAHLHFDREALRAGYNRVGLGMGLQGTAGKVSAYLRVGFYRAIASGTFNGARSYYWELAYGNRIALNKWFALDGEIYTDIHPEFGSRPYGIKLGASVALGRVSLTLLANHNRDVNALEASLRFAF